MSDQVDDAHDAPDAPDPEPVGELAEEAAKLLGALGAWAREQGPDLGAAFHDAAEHLDAREPASAAGGREAPDCHWCPVCRTAHLVRQVSPEVREQLGIAAAALLQAGSGLLASLAAAGPQPERGAGGAGGTERPERAPRVERIDLDPDPGGDRDPHDHPDHPEHPGGPR